MEWMVSFLVLLGVFTIVIFILVFPLHLAARAMDAERNGTGWCLLSLLAASFMQILGMTVPVFGNIVAFLLSSAVFAGILGTTFLRGIGIAVLHIIFSILILWLAVLLLGVSFTGLCFW